MKYYIIVIFIFSTLFSMSQQLNRVIFDDIKEKNILFGEVTKEIFKQSEFTEWFSKEYNKYEVSDTVFENNYNKTFDSIYVFLATWCEDSQREIPRFMKIMESFYFLESVPIRYFCVDGNKYCDVIDCESYYVQLIPTFIFYKRGEELCRIIESPRISLEVDILDLLERLQ